MAKVSYLQLPAGIDLSFAKGLNPGDRFMTSRLRRTCSFLSRKRVKGLTQKSLLPQISLDWANLTTEQKQVWNDIGPLQELNGWRYYVKDKCLRIKNALTGDIVPNEIYQDLVGQINISSPASHIKITQLHPESYWVLKKVKGTKSQYSPVQVTEQFSMPLSLSLSYKTNLVSTGPNSYVRFYAVVYSLYQGTKIENPLIIEMPLVADWTGDSATLDTVVGFAKDYTLFIEAYNVRGDIWFDNVSAFHSGQNWCRDPFCRDINQSFTRAFYQIPKHWAPLDLPSGSSFESLYYEP